MSERKEKERKMAKFLDKACNDVFKILEENLKEFFEENDPDLEKFNIENIYRNILINIVGNGIFRITRLDKGIMPFKNNANDFMSHLRRWFDDSMLVQQRRLIKKMNINARIAAMNEISNQEFAYQITSLDQAMEYAKLISESDLAPKDYRGKPGNVLIAMQFGAEVGLKPMQAIQNIAVINGRPSLWGDAMIALVQSHPLCEYIRENYENETAYCTVKRRTDDKEYTYEFSKSDAKTAGLLTKAGVWSQYPERMLQMRARGFALRDKLFGCA